MARDRLGRAAAGNRWRATPSRFNVFGFFAVALLSGSLANSLRSAGARLEQASNEIADLQALNQHVIDSLPSGLVTTDPSQRDPDVQPRAPRRSPASRRAAALGRQIADVLQLPAPMRRAPERRSRPRRRAAAGVSLPHRRRPRRDRNRPDRRRTWKRRGGRAGFLFTFQDVTDDQEARARRAPFSSGSRRSARWPPASRTRSAIRWRRCRGRFRSCARSCRSAPSRSS